MDWEESIRQYGLVPDDAALPAIRALLAREAGLERSGKKRGNDLALLCCVQLFSRGRLEDVLLIWEAKRSGFDLSIYLGVQLLCGAGLERTKEFLSQHSSPQAASALEYIMECEAAGDFQGWSPSGDLEYYREYFGEHGEST